MTESSERWRRVAPILLIVLVLSAYANSLNVPFIFDDVNGILDNVNVRRLLPLRDSMAARPDTAAAGRPVLSLTLAVNYAISGYHVWSYHLFNLLIHAAAAVTLFGLVRRTLAAAFEAPGGALHVVNGARYTTQLALLAAAIWAVHPLNTEAVTYVIKRNESLMALCYLLMLYCVVRSAAPGAERAAVWQLGAVVCCGLGMGVKETMATAPLVALAHDATFFSGGMRNALRRRPIMYTGLAATWGLLAWLVSAAPRSATTGFDLRDLTPWRYLLTQAGVILHYLRLAVWPVGQCLDYGWPVAARIADAAVPGLLIIALLALTAGLLWRRPSLGYPGFFFFVTLAPSSSFLPIREIACEYRMYLPLTSLCVAGVLVGHALLTRLRWHSLYARDGRGAAVVASLIVIALLALTIRRNHDYRSAEAIWMDTIRKAPHHPRPHNLLANTLARAGRLGDAEREFRAALALNENYVPSLTGLANVLAHTGRWDEAAAQHRRVLEIRPRYWPAHANLAALLLLQNKPEEALAAAERAIALEPLAVAPRLSAADALERLGRFAEARRRYEEVLELEPRNARARDGLENLSRPQ